MKRLAICCGLCLMASAASAALSKKDISRLDESARVIHELRDAPDNGVPEDLWTKAQCVLVLPAMKEAAFVIGGEYGTGVMSCRRRGGWSAPVFMRLAKGSVGLQIGAAEVDLVLIVMNQGGVDRLLQDKVTLGADASIAAGPVGRSGTAATDAQLNAQLLSYSRSHGVFAGIDLSGGVVRPDEEANRRAYGSSVNAKSIVEGKAAAPAAARAFLAALATDVRATTGGRR